MVRGGQPLNATSRVTATSENGQLEAVYGGTAQATYVDSAFSTDTAWTTAVVRMGPTQATVNFTDTYGATRTTYLARVEDVYVTVLDPNRNLSPATTDTIQVSIVNSQIGDVETVVLSEIGKSSGLFRNPSGVRTVVTSSPSPGNGKIEVAETGLAQVTIRADYSDDIAPPENLSAFASVILNQAALAGVSWLRVVSFAFPRSRHHFSVLWKP